MDTASLGTSECPGRAPRSPSVGAPMVGRGPSHAHMGGTTSPDIAARERERSRYRGRRAGGRPSLRALVGGASGSAQLTGNLPGARSRRGAPTACAGRGEGTKPCGPAQTSCGRGRAPGPSGADARLPARPGGWFTVARGPGSPEAASAHTCGPTCAPSLAKAGPPASVSPRR